jgi:hypothetical protein
MTLRETSSTAERLITEVESVQEKHEEKINKEKHDISQLTSILKDNKQELEFLKNHVGFVILVYIYLLIRIITK